MIGFPTPIIQLVGVIGFHKPTTLLVWRDWLNMATTVPSGTTWATVVRGKTFAVAGTNTTGTTARIGTIGTTTRIGTIGTTWATVVAGGTTVALERKVLRFMEISWKQSHWTRHVS